MQTSEPPTPKSHTAARPMLVAGTLAIFSGAFLLFQVQPIMARFILPTFGGSPDVWTTCMLFFQLLLLAGYAWAHLLTTRIPPRLQAAVHVVLLVAALIALPIIPAPSTENAQSPVLQILLLLTRSVGLPFFMLAATSPLIQAWFSRTVNAAPYRLYALSNTGSLLALLTYPFLFEPTYTRSTQAALWADAFGGFVIFSTAVAVFYTWAVRSRQQAPSSPAPPGTEPPQSPPWRTRLLWLLLPAGATVVLLAVTNKISQDITVVPLFWIVPLAFYLLSFILAFDHSRWYVRKLWVTVFVLSFIGLVSATMLTADIPASLYIATHTLTLFACCMVFHGELYRLRPHAGHLTAYYLAISLGGALGGLFVVVIAPRVFSTYFELYVGLLGCCLFILLTQPNPRVRTGPRRLAWVCLIAVAAAAGFTLQRSPRGLQGKALARSRNFFGILTVWEQHDPERRLMQHGETNHGVQFTRGPYHNRPLAYYAAHSGVGLAIKLLPDAPARRVGVIGLGAGAIAAYARPDDHFTFYEINPEVERLARTWFTYLEDCPAKVDVVIGDARLSLAAEPPQNFDLLVLDAFTGDAVPVHLLTAEAFDIYLAHLSSAPHAALALHVSSNHVDLPAVVRRLAGHFGLHAAWIETHQDETLGTYDSDWILLSRDAGYFDNNIIKSAATPFPSLPDTTPLWTDDHTNLLPVLK